MKLEIFENVYEPAEDSYMLAEHAKKLKGKILDMGTGCGIVALTNAKHNPKNFVEGCDINESAVRNAEHNARVNGIRNVRFFVSDMFNAVPKNKKYNWIVFNPPYLPTEKNEKIKGKLNYAFDGGRSGRKILDRFLKECRMHLENNGGVMLISSSLSGHEKTIGMLKRMGFEVEILEEKKFFFERLYAVRAKLKEQYKRYRSL
ncbi:MAG: class I SAM-dependent methyltransferase [Candidatus Anstonellales archaeon]